MSLEPDGDTFCDHLKILLDHESLFKDPVSNLFELVHKSLVVGGPSSTTFALHTTLLAGRYSLLPTGKDIGTGRGTCRSRNLSLVQPSAQCRSLDPSSSAVRQTLPGLSLSSCVLSQVG